MRWLLMVLLGLGVLAGNVAYPEETRSGSIPLGARAPSLPEDGWVGGPPMTEAEVAGKVVIYYFFQPGCGSCDEFTLHLRRLQRRFGDRFVAIGVADRSVAEISKFGTGINRIYRFLRDPGGIFRKKFLGYIDVLPSYALVDQRGRLIWADAGKYRLPFALEVNRVLGEVPPRKRLGRGRPRALVVGVGSDPLSGRELPCAVNDSKRLYARLQQSGFDTTLLLRGAQHPDAGEATPGSILRAIHSMTTARDTEQFLFYYSGSALQRGEKASLDIDLLMGAKGQPDALSLKEASAQIARAQCPTLTLIDVGHQSANVTPYRPITQSFGTTLNGVPVIFACNGMNALSRTMPGIEPATTRFGHFMMEALAGEGDVNGDRLVSGVELFRHIWMHLNDKNRVLRDDQLPLALNLTKSEDVLIPLPAQTATSSRQQGGAR